MSGIIDMQQSNLKPNQRFFPGEPEEYQAINNSDTPIEACRYFGETHASYGWNRQLDPRWTDQQKEAYHEGYNFIKGIEN